MLSKEELDDELSRLKNGDTALERKRFAVYDGEWWKVMYEAMQCWSP